MNIEKLISLFQNTHSILQQRAARSVDSALVVRNWLFGWYIVEFENGGAERTELYGKELIKKLSEKLTANLGKGFSKRSLEQFRQFYLTYKEITQALPAQSPNALQNITQALPGNYQTLIVSEMLASNENYSRTVREIKHTEIMKNFELQMDLNRSLLFEIKQNPEYSRLNSLIILILLFLSILGVVVPLYLMPITDQPNFLILVNNIFSIRSLFILPPFLLFFIFLFFLHKTHENLKHGKNDNYSKLIISLEKYSDFSEYEKRAKKPSAS